MLCIPDFFIFTPINLFEHKSIYLQYLLRVAYARSKVGALYLGENRMNLIHVDDYTLFS